VGLDRLGHQPLAADALEQHLSRHLPLAEARHLDALRQVVGCVLDGVVDVMRRHLDREPDTILRQLLDLRLHLAIQAGSHHTRSNVAAVSAWTLTLLGGAGAIWAAMLAAMVYAARVRA
jgi:hypothetical protein